MSLEIRFERDGKIWFVGWSDAELEALDSDHHQMIEDAIGDLEYVALMTP